MNVNTILNTCFVSSSVDTMSSNLIYYSHLIPIFFSLFLAFLVLMKGRTALLSKIFFIFAFVFVLWLMGDLIAWISNNYYLVYTTWSFLVYLEIIFYVLGFYFAVVFAFKKDILVWQKIVLFLITLPPFLITILSKSVTGFDYPVCEAFNNNFLDIYKLIVEILLVALVFLYMIIPFLKKTITYTKKSAVLVLGSMFLFLAVFGIAEYLAAFSGNYEIHLYSLFIIPIFLVAITYSIFSLDIFNLQVVSTYFFVFGFLVLTASQLLFITSNTDRFLSILTLSLAVIFSIFLFRNLRKESKQRIHIEKLNVELGNTIQQRESLVHLITHKVKGSFTHSKYIFAGILDGTFGEASEEIKKVSKMGLDSDNEGVRTVDLVLNASNLQKGTVKYDLKKIDFKTLIKEVIEAKKEVIKEKGLELEENIPDEEFFVNGDVFWLKEVINNLVENSTRYTEKGKISIGLSKNNGKALFSVKDTGIGITDEDKKNLFKEGGRGKESVKVNVDSTGYGLYSVKLIMDGHKGRVWAESEGKGKGSSFFVELDLI